MATDVLKIWGFQGPRVVGELVLGWMLIVRSMYVDLTNPPRLIMKTGIRIWLRSLL